MNLEALLASAKPFLFQTLEDPRGDDPSHGPIPTIGQTPKPTPARTQRPPSQWFLTPHALLRRSPFGKYALLGVFHRFPDAARYAAEHYSFKTRPTYYDVRNSAAAWEDSEKNVYLICPHPDQHTPLRINPYFDPTVPREGPWHLRYADPDELPRTQTRFPTFEHAYASLSMSRDLSKAVSRHFAPRYYQWTFRTGARIFIQERKHPRS